MRPGRSPDELAFAFCCDVLAARGSMPLTAMSSLLAPWGWTRGALLERLHALQNDGLVMLADIHTSKKRLTAHVQVTTNGKYAFGVTARGAVPATPSEPLKTTKESPACP